MFSVISEEIIENNIEEMMGGDRTAGSMSSSNNDDSYNTYEEDQLQNSGPNVIVMSDAAKPIYCRWGDEEDYITVCSLIQAIRGSIRDDDEMKRGDLQYIEVDEDDGDGGTLKVAFVSIGSLTLLAISNSDFETDAYLRLQLEYVYGQIIFTLTDHVQSVFQRSPNIDIRSKLGSTTHPIMDGMLSAAGPLGNGGPFLVSGVETICPISFQVRDYASRVLFSVCDDNNNNNNNNNKRHGSSNTDMNANTTPLFALLIVGRKLITMVQPKSPQHHLHTSDIHLIMNYVHCQPGVLSNSELWFPICLPRLNSSGFVHSYATCLDPETNLSVVLISQHNSTEQFELFRTAALELRKRIGLPEPKDGKILRITSKKTDTNNTNAASSSLEDTHYFQDIIDNKQPHMNANANEKKDTAENNNNSLSQANSDNNEVSSSPQSLTESSETNNKKEEQPDVVNNNNHNNNDASQAKNSQNSNSSSQPPPKRSIENQIPSFSKLFHNERKSQKSYNLKDAIKEALQMNTQKELIETYCKIAQAMHFVFRCDVSVRNHKSGIQTGGVLTQCLSPPLEFPFIDGLSKRRVWSMYQRLSLRIRLGSASTESTMDAFDVIMDDLKDSENDIGKDCPAQCLMETPPSVHGVSYILDGNELFVVLNGKDFELYATLPAIVPPKTGTMLCARLVRRLWADEGKLFLACPLSWRI